MEQTATTQTQTSNSGEATTTTTEPTTATTQTSPNADTTTNIPDGGLLGKTTTQADVVANTPKDSIWGEKQPHWPTGMEGQDWTGFKESGTLKNFVNDEGDFKVPQMIKALVNLDKLRGSDVVAIPSKDATAEEKSDFLKKALGFDYADINSYELESTKLSPEVAESLKKTFFDNKLPPSIANDVMKQMEQQNQKFATDWQVGMEKDIADGVDALKNKWADAFDSKVANAKRALNEIAPPHILETIQKDPLISNHPVLVELMSTIGDMMYQENVVNRITGTTGGMTREQIEAKINEIRSGEVFFNQRHPRYNDVQKEVDALYAKLG